MVQKLKRDVRAAMLEAASEVFAEAGFAGATMAEIARRAGVATGNLYRYFANKAALFDAVCPPALAEEFLALLRRRVGSLVETEDLQRLGAAAEDDAAALLRFWIDHRLEVVILLDRAAGTAYEHFRERFIDELTRPTLARLRAASGRARLRPVQRFLVRQVFENTVRAIVAILESHEREAAIREAFFGFWSYQLAGLAGLEDWIES